MSAAEKTEFVPTKGLHLDVPQDVYRAAEGVAASDLKNMQRSPAFAHMRSSVSTPAQLWGTAVHTAILEPEELYKRYAEDPEHPEKGGYPAGWRNTKAYKEQKAELLSIPGVEGLLELGQLTDLAWIQKRVGEDEIGAQLHALAGHNEASAFAWDDEFGLWRKCRPDRLIPDARMIVDVKTSNDHRPHGFARACRQYGYHMSAAYYLDTISDAMDQTFDHYVFLVVNSDAPFECASYTLDADSIEQGRYEYRRALAEWRECVETGRWPATSGKIQELRLPEWAITYHYEGME